MAEKQLIIAVEGTAALGPFWKTIVTDYLEKIVRSFAGNEVPGQNASSSNVELALVMFNAHGSDSGILVQRSGWTKVVDTFLQWLYAIPIGGGGFNNVAVAEGLSEALMMLSLPYPSAGQTQQHLDGNKHCILVAASDPYPLPTLVNKPHLRGPEKVENTEGQLESRLSDAESVAKSYAMCSISLSVICPKQLPKLRAIYNAGKRDPHTTDTPIDIVKNPHHLVLIPDNFKEARSALTLSGTTNLTANSQNPVKVDTTAMPPVSGPATTSFPVNGMNGSTLSCQPVAAPNIPATVKVESNTGHMPLAPFPSASTVPLAIVSQASASFQNPCIPVSQEIVSGGDGVQEVKPVVSSMSLPMRPMDLAIVNILNEMSQAQQVMNSASLTGALSIGLPSMGPTPVAMHMSNMISSGQNVFSAGQTGITSMNGGLGSMAGSAPVIQNTAAGSVNSATSNMSGNANSGLSQPLGSNLQGGVTMSPSVSGINQGNVSSQQTGQSGNNMSQTLNGLGSLTLPPRNNPMMPNPNMAQMAPFGVQSINANNNSAADLLSAQQASNALQSAESEYVKVWEGNLLGLRHGQPVFITRLEGYRHASAPENLVENWPFALQIVRLISQDHMNNKQYVGKADFLEFRALPSHGFLGRMQEKKLCAVIRLVPQTLLLSVSDKGCRLKGILFPWDMVVFVPQHQQMPSQQQNPQLQQLQQQQNPQQPQQHHQHMVGTAINQGFVEDPTLSQLGPPTQGQSQQQVASQVSPNRQGPGACFMS